MSSFDTDFYVAGGTLPPNTPSYVKRLADDELNKALCRGDFCYVLTSRQMGKSSLMAQTAARLRMAGTAVAILDLTEVGQHVSIEQWYNGLATLLEQQLHLEDELKVFQATQTETGPCQRFFRGIRAVVLPALRKPRSYSDDSTREGGHIGAGKSIDTPDSLVVFVDEIDTVRSLKFSTDEFFAGIRSCYNGRSQDPELRRLSFCLLGVATPSDLIRNTELTPFNIGHRIELHDFTAEEAQGLVGGLGPDERIAKESLRRVLYWTNGHPYLTQRLCLGVAEDQRSSGTSRVDEVCAKLFLGDRARKQDDNLLFVRERMLRSGEVRRNDDEMAGLLELYAKVHTGTKVPDDSTDPRTNLLRLAGIIGVENGRLRVRNRIYERVFDRGWVRENMPSAELRRQKAAFRKGVIRTAGIAVILLAMLVVSIQQTRVAREQHGKALLSRIRLAEDYFSDYSPISLAYLGSVLRDPIKDPVAQAVAAQRLISALTYRRFAMPQTRALQHGAPVNMVRFNENGSKVVTVCEDGTAQVWDTTTGRKAGPLITHGVVKWAEFSPVDANVVVTVSDDRTARIWDLTGSGAYKTLQQTNAVLVAKFSRDGKLVATATANAVAVWDASTGKLVAAPFYPDGGIDPEHHASLQFSRDGKYLLTGGWGAAQLWNLATGRSPFPALHRPKAISGVDFSPDGNKFVTASWDNFIYWWETATGKPLCTNAFVGMHTAAPYGVQFDSTGHRVLSFAKDGRVKIWNADTGRMITNVFLGASVLSAEFSPNGMRFAAASVNGSAQVFDTATGAPLIEPIVHKDEIRWIEFSPDGARLATASADKTVRIWNLPPNAKIENFVYQGPAGKTNQVKSAAFSADGARVITATLDNTPRIWDVRSGRLLVELRWSGTTPELAEVGSSRAALRAVFSPNGRWVAAAGTASNNGVAQVWEAGTGKPLGEPIIYRDGLVRCLEFSADSKRLLCTGGTALPESTVRLFDLREAASLERSWDEVGDCQCASFSPDMQYIIAASDGDSASIFEIASGRRLWHLPHREAVSVVRFSPQGGVAATASWDGTAKLWEVSTGKLRGWPLIHMGSLLAMEFSTDGTMLGTGSADATARLWDVKTGSAKTDPLLHKKAVLSVQFSPDGRRMVTASADSTARIWDTDTGLAVSEPLRHGDIVNTARFSPDGKYVLTASDDGTARLWPVLKIVAPAPDWLPELAEAVGGLRLNDKGQIGQVDLDKLLDVRDRLKATKDTDFFSRWAHWFFADPGSRSDFPF